MTEESKEDIEHLCIEAEGIVKILDVYINYADEPELTCLLFLTDGLKEKMNRIQELI